MTVAVEVAVLLALAVLCGAAPPPRPVGIAIIRNIVGDKMEYARNHIPNRFQVKGTIIKSGSVNQKIQPAPFQRVPSILGIDRNHIPNRFDIKGTPVGGAGAGQQSQGQAYQPAPAVPDCCNPGGYGQYPGQYPSQVPGQYPSQVPGQYPAQFPGQYPGQVPGQYPSQFTPPECCNVGGMGQYPQAPPPAGCCGAAPSGQSGPGSSGGLIVPLRGPKGEKTGFLRIGQHGSVKKLPPPPPPADQAQAQPQAQGAAPSPYGASPVQGQGTAPYGAPPQPYGYQAQGSYPQPYGQQPYGAQGMPGQTGGYKQQNQGGFYPMDQQSDEARQSDAQPANAPPQSQVQPQFPQTEPFQEIQAQAFDAKKRTRIWASHKGRRSLINN